MRPIRFELNGHRSVDGVAFDAEPVTVLFGKNNAGKTNILEAAYMLLTGDHRASRPAAVARDIDLCGGFWVELEEGLAFDEQVATAAGVHLGDDPVYVRFTGEHVQLGQPDGWDDQEPETLDDALWEGHRGDPVGAPQPHVLMLDWDFTNLHDRFAHCVQRLATTDLDRMRGRFEWLDALGVVDGRYAYAVRPRINELVEDLAALATDLLPDFVEGVISAHVSVPTMWDDHPKILLEYHERGATQCPDVIELAGSGAARWMAAAVQLAIHLVDDDPELRALRTVPPRALSGHVILLDEPEAHLHPSAVASVVRWCRRLARHGMTVMVASHHEEFLRASGEEIQLVHVTRDEDLVGTSVRALTLNTTSALQELATDVGMHPAAVLSLHNAVVFVEGPLDVAVLEEYASVRLEAAGVMLVAIHGTKNLEGLISEELVRRLGLRIGILTDATDPETMSERSGRRRSSEERKVLKVLERAAEEGLPKPQVFGVTEADLLFALPPDGVASYLGRDFPDWKELVAEARAAVDASPSESVNWKQYAFEKYGLPIHEPSGVREVVRHLDLAGVPLPSIETAVSSITRWASHGDEADA